MSGKRDVDTGLRQAPTPQVAPGVHRAQLKQSLMQAMQRKDAHVSRRRILLDSRWTKVGAAVAAAVAVAVGLLLLPNGGGTVAYALEQTLVANEGVRSVHLAFESPKQQGQVWAEFDGSGKPLRMGAVFDRSENGPTAIVWRDGVGEVWHKATKMLFVIPRKDILAQMAEDFYDPRAQFENLYREWSEGVAEVERLDAQGEGRAIRLAVTRADEPDVREVYVVDEQTKLVVQVEKYTVEDGQEVFARRVEYLAYNESIDSAVFVLDVPDDVERTELTTVDTGLAQGDLSDDEIAMELARAFIEALIAEDYELAGRLHAGMPASFMEKHYGPTDEGAIVGIVEVGQPERDAEYDRTRVMRVPVTLVVRRYGQELTKDDHVLLVFEDPDRRGRWLLGGGELRTR